MLHFRNAKVAINGTGIMADTASLDLSNNLTPILAVGKRGMINLTPNGELTANISFSYPLEPGNEPIKGIVNYIKNNVDTAGNQAFVVELAGITGSYYLD